MHINGLRACPCYRALLQRGAIASHASNILPGSGAQFHRDETTRQPIYVETRSCLSVQTVFGNSPRSGPPAMGTAKRNGPSVRRGHRLSVIAVHDRFVLCAVCKPLFSVGAAPRVCSKLHTSLRKTGSVQLLVPRSIGYRRLPLMLMSSPRVLIPMAALAAAPPVQREGERETAALAPAYKRYLTPRDAPAVGGRTGTGDRWVNDGITVDKAQSSSTWMVGESSAVDRCQKPFRACVSLHWPKRADEVATKIGGATRYPMIARSLPR
jgi:hypothetical protein